MRLRWSQKYLVLISRSIEKIFSQISLWIFACRRNTKGTLTTYLWYGYRFLSKIFQKLAKKIHICIKCRKYEPIVLYICYFRIILFSVYVVTFTGFLNSIYLYLFLWLLFGWPLWSQGPILHHIYKRKCKIFSHMKMNICIFIMNFLSIWIFNFRLLGAAE